MIRFLFFGVILFAYIFTVQWLAKCSTATDFASFYHSAQLYFSGLNIYMPWFYLNSEHQAATLLSPNLGTPFFNSVIIPFGALKYAHAFMLWSGLNIAGFLLGLFLLQKKIKKNISFLLLASLFLIYWPNYQAVYFGQITGILFLLFVLFWDSAREQKDISAGILLGILCGLKLFFGLYGLLFLCARRVKLLLVAACIFLACGLYAMLQFGVKIYMGYYNILRHIHWINANLNASLLGFLVRAFGSNLFSYGVYILCSLVLIFLLIKVAVKLNHSNFDLIFSLVIVSMLFISPLGWSYYFGLLVVPYIVLPEFKNKTNFILLHVALLFSAIPSAWHLEAHEKGNALLFFKPESLYFYSLILLFILNYAAITVREASAR